METYVMWATILSPVVAVLIAAWTAYKSGKDTTKQIAALEESTNKQVESIKALSKQQIESSIKMVELEIEKNLFFAKQAKQEMEGINDINHSNISYFPDWKDKVMSSFQENKPERDYHNYSQYIKVLIAIKQGLEANKKIMN